MSANILLSPSPVRAAALALGCMIAMLLHPFPAGAQAQGAQDDGPDTDTAPVIVDGRELFRVQGLASFSADKRAAQIADRIRAIADDADIAADALSMTETERGTLLSAGDRNVMTVVDADARLEHLNRGTLAAVYHDAVRKAIEAYRSERTSEYLIRSALYALAATVALCAFLWIGNTILRRVDASLGRRVDVKLEGLEEKSMRIVSAAHIRIALRGLRNALWVIAVLLAVFFYLDFLLQLFPWTRWLSVRLLAMLMNPLQIMGNNVLAAIPDLIFLAVLVFVVRYLLKVVKLFFTGVERGTVALVSFEREWALPTYRLLRLIIIAFAVVVAFPYIPGSGSDAFKGISLFLGVMFSLGSTSVISNMVAGYSLIYRRAFNVGDRVRVGGDFGEVMHSRLLVTHLRTPKNEVVIIPNSTILNSNVINYSTMAREGRLILHTTVGIGYETPWRQVEAMLLLAAGRTRGLATDPRPFVLQKGLGDFCVQYEINVYCADATQMPRLYTALHQNILDVFNEYGVQIMTPAYEGDPEQPKVVSRENWYAEPARMSPATPD